MNVGAVGSGRGAGCGGRNHPTIAIPVAISAIARAANVDQRDWPRGGADGHVGGPAAVPGNWLREAGNPSAPYGVGGPLGGLSDMERWYRSSQYSVFTVPMRLLRYQMRSAGLKRIAIAMLDSQCRFNRLARVPKPENEIGAAIASAACRIHLHRQDFHPGPIRRCRGRRAVPRGGPSLSCSRSPSSWFCSGRRVAASNARSQISGSVRADV